MIYSTEPLFCHLEEMGNIINSQRSSSAVSGRKDSYSYADESAVSTVESKVANSLHSVLLGLETY